MARESIPADRLQRALVTLRATVDILDDIATELEGLAVDIERNNDDDIASGNVWPEPLDLVEPAPRDVVTVDDYGTG